ncbi:X-ray repair cross-complementing protein 5-like isoform X1 [Apis cerana]|uniref:ATP-dependent DNA helicase n=2 Tax=Apis cerana TaxID=7461 RepID=A0A2A3EGA8_APICC|nr:X-ray repair cross-complementing protein 5-like isoform X1 [Apis cerana]PBC30259.1 ATP-dependent DNA helicase [Apis cerana cerana]
MSSKRKESLVLLLNIGVTNPNIENNSLLFEKAKHIAQRKIEKMIFLKPKDEVAIMLMGSSITKNNLNSKYIEEFTDFQVPNWDFVRKCMNLKSTKYCYNWIEALYAAVEFIKQNVIDNSLRKIILMSDFNEETNIISKFEAKLIANKLFEEKIELITISENLLHDKPLTSLNSSKKLLKDVHDQINGQHIIFDDAIASLKFYEETPGKPFPFYYDLQLFDKKIPIVSYVKIDIEKFPSWKKAKGNQKLQSKTEYLDGQRNSYAKDEIIKGYKYGGTFIPVEKELEDKMSYKSGMKSYTIYGFTDKNNIDLEHFYKSATHVILPSSNVTKPFYSLVQAMHETNSVAIVRKVFRNNSTPRMVALFPCIDIPDEPWCLVEIELAFAEDRRLMESRPMKSIIKQLSNEQNKAVDDLINSLMLNDIQDSYGVDGNQYFLPGCVPNPAIQHRWHILSYRAINPDKPLPAMENYLKKILEAPLIKERSKSHMQNIAQLFRLENIDLKARKKSDINEVNMQIDDNSDTKDCNKIEDKVDIENNSYKEDSILSLDTSDVDLDELVANI